MTNSIGFTGVSVSVMNYYNVMDKTNIIIDFVVPNKVDDSFKNLINSNGGKVYQLSMRNRNPFQYLCQLTKIMKTSYYDIVHTHGNSCTLVIEMCAAILAGVKIRIAHSHNTTCSHKFINKLLRPFFNKTYTHGFACGLDAGKWLFRNKEFTVILNGININKFTYNFEKRKEYKEKYNIKEKKVIGHVGAFNYQKNHEFLIDIFYELTKIDPNYVLMLAGDGELRPLIEQKVISLGLYDKVVFLGKTLEVPELIQAMDIMVLPSRFEGLPIVLIEWQSACLPCLVSDKVTKEAKLTNLIEFMSLEKEAIIWAQKIHEITIIDREEIREQILKELQEAGYDINHNAAILSNLYLRLANAKNKVNK